MAATQTQIVLIVGGIFKVLLLRTTSACLSHLPIPAIVQLLYSSRLMSATHLD